jgi:hypothetical protein
LNRLPHTRRRTTPAFPNPLVESLESRVLLSAAAAGQLQLLSTSGTSTPVYTYGVTLTDTGTTKLGTLWFSWLPGEGFLPSSPSNFTSPAGWSAALTNGPGGTADGFSIQWVAQSAGADVAPGSSLGGFGFSSADSPAVLSASSPAHPASPILTSTVYSGVPFSDAGTSFVVAEAGASSGAATTTTLSSSAPSAAAGASVTFTATVAPISAGATPTGTVTFLEGGATLSAVALQSDGTAQFSTSALPVGADPITARYGGDATYAASVSPTITETITGSGVNSPTLVPTIGKSNLGPAIVSGARTRAVVLVDVSNQTAATFKGKTTVDLFATTDDAIDGASVLVGSVTRNLNIKAGKAAAVPVKVSSTLAGLAAGQYTLIARTIDPSGREVDSNSGPSLQVAAPFIALSESFAALTLPATISAGARTRALAALNITNNGNVQASGPTTLSLYASGDGGVDGSAMLIQSVVKTLRIKPGKSIRVSMPIRTFPSLAAGKYFIVAQVTDPSLQKTSAIGAMQVTVS